MASNPYVNNSGIINDVDDAITLISAADYNKLQETLRHVLAGSQFQSSNPSADHYVVDQEGFNYENMCMRVAGHAFFISRNEADPVAAFQQACLTHRGSRKHIFVDSSIALGNCNNLINSETTIEGAVFDYVGNTYKEMSLNGIGMTSANYTITGASNPYTIDFSSPANVVATQKINVGDIVINNNSTFTTPLFGEVVSIIDSDSITVNFNGTPGAPLDRLSVYKKNITFLRCRFNNQVHILNTYACRFIDCEFEYNDSTMFGGVIADNSIATPTTGVGNVWKPHIQGCVFKISSTGITLATLGRGSGIKTLVELDGAQNATIVDNLFHGTGIAPVLALNYPISGTATRDNGVIMGNNIRRFAETAANIKTQMALVAALYDGINTRDNAIL